MDIAVKFAAVALSLVTITLGMGCGDDSNDAGSSPADAPEPGSELDLPASFTGPFLEIRAGSQQLPEELGALLETDDGTVADLSLEAGQPAAASGKGDCSGTAYDEVATTDEPLTGTIEIEGNETISLAVDETRIALAGAGPPACDERTGTWTSEDGGETGTFTVAAEDPDSPDARTSLTLEPAR